MPPHLLSMQALTAVSLCAVTSQESTWNGDVDLQRRSLLWKDPQHGGVFHCGAFMPLSWTLIYTFVLLLALRYEQGKKNHK